jgi:pyruvate ferredoxin oxidoreductase beta subunit
VVSLKEIVKKERRLSPGHRLCPGCGASIVVNMILWATDDPVVIGIATGCLEVSTTIYPQTAWEIPYIHSAFENAASTISGVETAYRALKKKGEIKENIKFVAFGGDGGTYDIGLQALSGAMERGHNMVYVCYDNEAYMNTGIQRSSATPLGASTTTSPAGNVIPGKLQKRKDLTYIMAAHQIPYVAQGSISHWRDLVKKASKAFEVDGPAFLNVLSPCPRGWRYDSKLTINIAKEAVTSNFWPLYEVENGDWRLTYKPKEKTPIENWLKKQGRFNHLFKPENTHIIDEIQNYIDNDWENLLKRCSK